MTARPTLWRGTPMSELDAPGAAAGQMPGIAEIRAGRCPRWAAVCNPG